MVNAERPGLSGGRRPEITSLQASARCDALPHQDVVDRRVTTPGKVLREAGQRGVQRAVPPERRCPQIACHGYVVWRTENRRVNLCNSGASGHATRVSRTAGAIGRSAH